jgi:hypothetical protein
MAIKKQGGYSEQQYLKAMKEVIVPVTMTSVVNACMFGVMNISDIPAVYITARVAVYSVIALYLAIILCFPAYCYLDMKRQAKGMYDFFFCFKKEGAIVDPEKDDFRSVWLYHRFYQPLVLGAPLARRLMHPIIWLAAGALLATGSYGITQREIGLNAEDFYPESHQASVWGKTRTKALASWTFSLNWGAIDYTKPDTQLKMIKQFEEVISTPRVAETDTIRLWIANFLIWTSRHCTDNFAREDFEKMECKTGKKIVQNVCCLYRVSYWLYFSFLSRRTRPGFWRRGGLCWNMVV